MAQKVLLSFEFNNWERVADFVNDLMMALKSESSAARLKYSGQQVAFNQEKPLLILECNIRNNKLTETVCLILITDLNFID